MPAISILCGAILIAIGLFGYFYGAMSGASSFTALIPAAFGLVLGVCGLAAMFSEGLRRHLMHAASAVALLGFILTAGRLLMKLGDISMTLPVLSQASTALVCLIFVFLAVRSFARARAAGADQP